MTFRKEVGRVTQRARAYGGPPVRAVKGAGNVVIFVAAVIAGAVAIGGYIAGQDGANTASYSALYQRLTNLTVGGPLPTLIAKLGQPDFTQTWSLGRTGSMKDSRGLQVEWVVRTRERPVALVDALTSEADGNQIGLLGFVALVRSFRPTFHTFASPSRTITLNRSTLSEVTPARDASVGTAMPASNPGYYLESNWDEVPADGTPAYVVGDVFGSQPVPYSLIERLTDKGVTFLNFGANGDLTNGPNGGVPAGPVLEANPLRHWRATATVDTYALVDGWPGQYGNWVSGLSLPSGERF